METDRSRRVAGDDGAEPKAAGRPRRRWPAVLLAVAVVVAVLVYGWQTRSTAGNQVGIIAQVQPAGAGHSLATAPEVGKLAPNFLLKTTDGRTIRLSDLRGRPVLLNFWATWCPFCISEMPAMQQLAHKYDGKMSVLGVNVGEDADKASAYAADHGIHYTLALDPDLVVSHAYKVAAMPTSLFLDRDGIVRFVSYGPMTTQEMTKQLQPLLTS